MDEELLAFFRMIAARDRPAIDRALATDARLGVAPIGSGATRADAQTHFLNPIMHYVYAGDTALHVAAAAYLRSAAETFVALGAAPRARNRRGAEPLHYAADGIPGSAHWEPEAQRAVIAYLIGAGADPDARDKSGVAPLHRAVRTRCSAAVRALLDGGADPRLGNKRGSTPLHLAVQNTGRGDAGTVDAKDEQREIIAVLLQHGARTTDTDVAGKTVEAAVSSDGIRALLDTGGDARRPARGD